MKKQTFIEKCYKDSEGKVTIGQKPNLPIIIWLSSLLLLQFTTGKLYVLIDFIGFGALFTWAYLELFHGVNYFRRFLGFIVLFVVLLNRTY